jgi:FAD-linked sulfhydryl oxidase
MRLAVLFTILVCTSAKLHEEPTCDCACEDLDRDRLGQSTWYLLHEIVTHVPETKEAHFKNLIYSLSHLYPCETCRKHIGDYIGENSVELNKHWLCDFHNDVNVRLGKASFDCSTL